MREVYLDNNATTKPLPEVREAMMRVLGEDFGNPSSAHSAGDRVREEMVVAREAVASWSGLRPIRLCLWGVGLRRITRFLILLFNAPNGKTGSHCDDDRRTLINCKDERLSQRKRR